MYGVIIIRRGQDGGGIGRGSGDMDVSIDGLMRGDCDANLAYGLRGICFLRGKSVRLLL